MKRYTMTLMFAAAALAAAAGSASAQDLTAEIPFTFRAAGVQMAPGSYTVKISHGSATKTFVLRNVDLGRSVIIANYIGADPSKDWRAEGKPKMGFDCAGHNCVLRTLWTPDDPTAYRFLGPRPTGDEPVHVAEIRLTPVKSE